MRRESGYSVPAYPAYFNPRTREGCDIHRVESAGRRQPDFNPRTREGCDLLEWLADLLLGKISIHAPVKGATATHRAYVLPGKNFNPRTREGCDDLAFGFCAR